MNDNTTNNFNNPKGYALLLGINEFQNSGNNLLHCVGDVNYWKNYFVVNHEYDKINSLTNDKATLTNFVCAIWSLAARALPGDVVSITISTHGLMNDQTNALLLYDSRINENQFHFLLKAFKPLVRIFIITDACRSGSWIERRNKTIAPGELKELKDLLKGRFSDSHSQLDMLFNNQASSDVLAVVNHLATANDFTDVPDGVLTKINTKKQIQPELYSIEQYRAILAPVFRDMYDLEDCVNVALELMDLFPKIKEVIEFQRLQSDFYFYRSFLRDQFQDRKTMVVLLILIEGGKGILNDEDEKVFNKKFGFLSGYYSYKFSGNPVVNYTGLNSPIFKNARMFKKRDYKFNQFYSRTQDRNFTE